jgi:hypothetical protein
MLHLSGEDRPAAAYRRMLESNHPDQESSAMERAHSVVSHFEELVRADRLILYRRYPDLKMSRSSQRRAAEQAAAAQLTREADAGKWKDLLDADAALDTAEQNVEAEEIADSHLIRFVRLCKSVVLAHTLQQTGSPAIKSRFARLLQAEGRSLLPPADTIAETTDQQD